jgi:predicted nucleic acid-binding protein
MMRLFVDANIIIDALAAREAHDAEEAKELLLLGEQRAVTLLTTSLSIGVVLYQYQRSDADKRGPRLKRAQLMLEALLACLEVVPVEADHFQRSIASGFGDLEDGAQYWAVVSAGTLDAIVSRDPDYDGHIGVKRLSAKQALRLVKRKK